ncbi:MAG: hypothetical protein ACOVNU_11620 [Candidatus Kapaibacteriota bacterium]
MAKVCTGCGWLSNEDMGLNKNGNPFLACCPDSSYKKITDVEWRRLKIIKTIEDATNKIINNKTK